MILLFTDFGLAGPYQGQVKAVLHRNAPSAPVIDLFADAPFGNARAGAYLLAAYSREFPGGSVFLCVVDPGVGSDRRAVIVRADGRWFVGPDNGLLHAVVRQAGVRDAWEITWRPERLSSSFHGRDLFAPVAADLARGHFPEGTRAIDPEEITRDWPDDLLEVVYLDHFGNAITGVRAGSVSDGVRLEVAGRMLSWGRTFSEVALGEAFWYENANGLVEIAVNQGSAASLLDLQVGTPIRLIE
ncbi:MAG: SAM-dependent chlorinase/fluorinase [Gammaproteobacteria bacterium]